MQIPLNHFEDYIDEAILRRGLSYYKKGKVHEPEEILPGEYEAIVEGTEDYLVRMTIKNSAIIEHVCNCPYDTGPVCKHVVAVIFFTNPILRRKAIQFSLENRNYSNAISIALGGVDFDKIEKPGLVLEWYNWLLKIAQDQGESEKIIEYARRLFIENFMPEQDYYAILKQHVAPESWVLFVEKVIQDIAAKERWQAKEQIAEIFIKEGWLEKLLELVGKQPGLHTIGKYEAYLSKKYAAEVVELYHQAILEYVKTHLGRNHYQEACRYIRRVIKLGAREKANEMISFFRSEYRQRKALMEELQYV